MATIPWRSFERPEPERQYLVLLSYLPLKQHRRIPHFLLDTARITSQLRRSRGLVGYSLRAEFGRKLFWTLSAWEDEAALQRFVRAEPHARTMTAMMPHMGATRFARWQVKGSELPVSWDEALKHWESD